MFTAPYTHVAGETGRRAARLRPDRLLKALQPPGIGFRRPVRQCLGHCVLHLRRLGRAQFDLHDGEKDRTRKPFTRSRDLADLDSVPPFG